MPAQKPDFEHRADGVLLDVVDQHAVRVGPRVALEHVQDHPRAGVLVRQVRRVDQDQLAEAVGELDVLEKHRRLVLGVLVEANLADAQHVRGGSRNSGIIAITSRDSSTFSASLALMHSQV